MRANSLTPGELLLAVSCGLEPVAKAPSFRELEARADREGRAVDDIIADESFRRYKAHDRFGNIYKMQNPALMTWQVRKRADVVQGVEKVRILSRAEAEANVRGQSSRKNASKDELDF